MFGLTIDKLLVIGLMAVIFIGPKRLPAVASRMAVIIRNVRRFTDDAKTRVGAELGEAGADRVDWAALDPRRYDPRKFILEAWEDAAEPPDQRAVSNVPSSSADEAGADDPGERAGETATTAEPAEPAAGRRSDTGPAAPE